MPTTRSHRPRRAFTLVELLVVIGILAILAAAGLAGLRTMIARSRKAATDGSIQKIQLALASYYNDFRDYPPDGYDRDPAWGAATNTCVSVGPSGITLPTSQGPQLFSGSGCLIYFLCHPIPGPSGGVVGPYLELKDDQCSAFKWDPSFRVAIAPSSPEFKAEWATCEILDSDALPIHYDRVKPPGDRAYATFFDPNRFAGANGRAAHSDQRYLAAFEGTDAENGCCSSLGDNTHVGESAPIHGDPRSRALADGCFLDGPALRPWTGGDAYDLWAHGRSFANARTAVH